MIHAHDDDQQAVLGQVLAVAQHHSAHVAHAQAVDQHGAVGHHAGHVQLVLIQLDHVADLRDHHVVLRHAQLLGQLGVVVQVAVLAVHRNEELRAQQRVNQLQFLLAGVSGDVHLGQGFVDHVAADAEQLVDDAGDGLFVARDRGCGQDDHVALPQLHLAVLGEGHAGKAAHGLALAAGGHDGDLVIGIAVQLVHGDQAALRDLQIAQLHGHPRHVDHAAADQAHLAAVLHRGFDDRLDAVDVAGEHGDDDAARRLLKQVAEGLRDLLFGHGVAGALHVGGVRHQRQHALVADLRDAAQVDGLARQRRVVHLEVAGVEHHAHRGGDGQRARARDGVVHAHELHLERACGHHVARLHLVELRDAGEPVLLQLVFAQRQRQPRSVHGRGNLTQDVGHRADVILVAVGEEVAANLLLVLLQIADVRDHQIHAWHVLAREDGAQIHHNDVVLILQYRQVFTNLAQAAQRYDLQLG